MFTRFQCPFSLPDSSLKAVKAAARFSLSNLLIQKLECQFFNKEACQENLPVYKAEVFLENRLHFWQSFVKRFTRLLFPAAAWQRCRAIPRKIWSGWARTTSNACAENPRGRAYSVRYQCRRPTGRWERVGTSEGEGGRGRGGRARVQSDISAEGHLGDERGL